MQKIEVLHPDHFLNINRLEYVLRFLNAHPLNSAYLFSRMTDDTYALTIGYGVESSDAFVPYDDICLFNNRVASSSLVANEYRWRDTNLNSVEREKKEKKIFYTDQHFAFDIFNTIFFHISRYEEYFADPEDIGQAGWLEEDIHFLVRYGLQERPLVDELIFAFLEVLGAEIIPPLTTYDISHDVDILGRFTPIQKWVKSMGATLIYRRGINHLVSSMTHYVKMRKGKAVDPYNTFDFLLREEKFWQKKHIYLMAGGNTKYDNHYQLTDERLDNIIDLATQRGYEIGLHPSYNAGFEPDMYQEEKQKLEDKIGHPVRLNRQHWLRFSWQTTPDIWSLNSITQDSSMGYNRYLGFRCGTGFAYHMYDFDREQAYEWKEQPLALMESSAIHRAKLSETTPSELIKNFLRKNKYGTHISMNFHNSNFDPLLDTGRQLTHFYQNELLSILGED